MNTQLKIHHNKEITAVPALSQDELKTTTSVWFNGCPNLADVSELVKIGHRLHHIQLSTCPKIDLDQLILIDANELVIPEDTFKTFSDEVLTNLKIDRLILRIFFGYAVNMERMVRCGFETCSAEPMCASPTQLFEHIVFTRKTITEL